MSRGGGERYFEWVCGAGVLCVKSERRRPFLFPPWARTEGDAPEGEIDIRLSVRVSRLCSTAPPPPAAVTACHPREASCLARVARSCVRWLRLMAAQLRASSYVRYGLPVRQPADEAHVRTCVCLVGRGEAGMSAVCRLRVWACAEYVLPHRWRAALHDPCSGCNATVCLSVFLSAALLSSHQCRAVSAFA